MFNSYVSLPEGKCDERVIETESAPIPKVDMSRSGSPGLPRRTHADRQGTQLMKEILRLSGQTTGTTPGAKKPLKPWTPFFATCYTTNKTSPAIPRSIDPDRSSPFRKGISCHRQLMAGSSWLVWYHELIQFMLPLQ